MFVVTKLFLLCLSFGDSALNSLWICFLLFIASFGGLLCFGCMLCCFVFGIELTCVWLSMIVFGLFKFDVAIVCVWLLCLWLMWIWTCLLLVFDYFWFGITLCCFVYICLLGLFNVSSWDCFAVLFVLGLFIWVGCRVVEGIVISTMLLFLDCCSAWTVMVFEVVGFLFMFYCCGGFVLIVWFWFLFAWFGLVCFTPCWI